MAILEIHAKVRPEGKTITIPAPDDRDNNALYNFHVKAGNNLKAALSNNRVDYTITHRTSEFAEIKTSTFHLGTIHLGKLIDSETLDSIAKDMEEAQKDNGFDSVEFNPKDNIIVFTALNYHKK
ncbi:hypothetical protein HN777_01220 [Candidatus Woesearchaeota archaeon]|jgi:hypothetical protein|nr:hypothetical protein [Candidatus Woesearchaeota archaeon]MBT7402393.1 hypothetical protein [Candidatus Woesearchaeota archaeon]